MYHYAAAIAAHWPTVLPCLACLVAFTYINFVTAVRQARAQQLHMKSFFAAAFFFRHDLSFVLVNPPWLGGAYDHWRFQTRWLALFGTVLLDRDVRREGPA